MTPNPNNYASLEMAHRLVEAGIVLKTETIWRQHNDECEFELVLDGMEESYDVCFPAPSMAEVLRVLPRNEELAILVRDHLRLTGGENYLTVIRIYTNFFSCVGNLCELLIWVKGRKK